MSKSQGPNSFTEKSCQAITCLSAIVLSSFSIASVSALAEPLLGRIDQRSVNTDEGNGLVEPGTQPTDQQCQIYDANKTRRAYQNKYLYSPIEVERPVSVRLPSLSRPDREAGLREAIALDPTDTGSYYELAGLLRISNRYAEAVVVLQQLIQQQPSEYFPYASFGEVLAEQGQIEEAIAALREALERVPAQAYSEDREPPEQRIYINIGDFATGAREKKQKHSKSYRKGNDWASFPGVSLLSQGFLGIS